MDIQYLYCVFIRYSREGINMGFPSPAADYVETRISLDQQLISQPAATYFMRASRSHFREGIIQGALLVVDASLTACDGSLLICAIDGEFRIKRYRTHPQPHLINLENGRREALPVDDDAYSSAPAIFGVITYIINDARNGEFDDCPVM
ncbi:TPA: S24 family peptidase [Citrobacter freundii]|uniref:HumD family translesion DNA polymerase n=1 Tax=Citrobacter freundii TaxID=546 RepID=UPI0023B1A708|nr:S24 family peptidase [Citrobacter freundii]